MCCLSGGVEPEKASPARPHQQIALSVLAGSSHTHFGRVPRVSSQIAFDPRAIPFLDQTISQAPVRAPLAGKKKIEFSQRWFRFERQFTRIQTSGGCDDGYSCVCPYEHPASRVRN